MMNENIKVYLQLVSEYVAKEFPKQSEEVRIATVNALLKEVMLENPEGEKAKELKAKALNIIAARKTGAESPYIPKPKFDYEKHSDETVGKSVQDIFKAIGKSASDINLFMFKGSEKDNKKSDKTFEELSKSIFEIFNKNKVGMFYFPYVFKYLRETITALEGIVDKQTGGHEQEIMSRMLSVRNPGDNEKGFKTFDKRFATYADLLKLLEKSRKDTGNKREDYFVIVDKDSDNMSNW